MNIKQKRIQEMRPLLGSEEEIIWEHGGHKALVGREEEHGTARKH